MTTAGLQPQAPADLNAQVIAAAQVQMPGLTANLPGSLIDDMAGTATGALVVLDQMRVDLVNSLTPYGCNAFLLNQLGAMLGVPIGADTNTGAYVVFSGPAGYVIPAGFTVSDGTYQYTVQDSSVIGTGGTSLPISVVATQAGSWAIPAGTVTQLVTSVPSVILAAGFAVTNPLAGTPGVGGQTEEAYRASVLQANAASAQGMTTFLKTLLNNIPNVQSRLIAVRQQIGGGWEVICGGSGDPYQIGFAIFSALFDISTLVGSTMTVTGISNATVAIVTTGLNHGLSSGATVTISGALGISGINGTPYTATVITPTTFSIPVNTTASGTYTGGGVVSPNYRNTSVSIYDYPDTYTVPFVIPPQQNVSMVCTWNTTSTGTIISPAAVAGAAQPAIAAYINTIPVGQPINVFELNAVFQQATAQLVPTNLLTRLVWSVAINGVGVAPTSGTGVIAGDPESYFQTTAASITVNQG
jgi:hypothetical protein